jgi:integrase
MGNEIVRQRLTPAMINAMEMWSQSTTSLDSLRYEELWRSKARTVVRFLVYVNKHPLEVKEQDVARWRRHLERKGLARATVYAMLSLVSSFYEWAMQDRRLAIDHNPVEMVRPKAPRPYEHSKALKPWQQKRLMDYVKKLADGGSVVAMRDYALLVMYFETGMRREEVMALTYGDVDISDRSTIETRVKGGEIVTVEIDDERVWRAVFGYLEASGRLWTIQDEDPLWARHDAGAIGDHDSLSSYGFVANLKRYARAAGVGDIHLHQTRHTHAKIVAENEGIGAAQESLGHKDQRTTRLYAGRMATRRDRHGPSVLDEVLRRASHE